jgi:hypothetical protein
MASSITTDLSISFPTPVASTADARKNRHRRIDPQAGRALEILGHAIEYLTDEFVESGAEMSASSPQLEAVQLLMGLNRRVYFECPVIPTLGERLRGVLHLHTA